MIKPGAAVVLARNPPVVQALVAATCARVGAPFVYAPEGAATDTTVTGGRTRVSIATPGGSYEDVPLALRGRHQVDNALTAVRLLEALAARETFAIGPGAIRTALSEAVWPARLEVLQWKGRDVLLDGAHNPAGARALAGIISAESTLGGQLCPSWSPVMATNASRTSSARWEASRRISYSRRRPRPGRPRRKSSRRSAGAWLPRWTFTRLHAPWTRSTWRERLGSPSSWPARSISVGRFVGKSRSIS